jgi:radical SAM superfamily enzyme YgiQ (UPF0313 family)
MKPGTPRNSFEPGPAAADLNGRRVLLVNVPTTWMGKRRPMFPLGICHVGSHLRQLGKEVDLVDLNVGPSPEDALRRLVAEFAPDWVGVSLRNAFFHDEPQLPNLVRTVATIRQARPAAPIIGGGTGLSLYAPGYLNEVPELDAVVFGEAEKVLERLIAGETIAVPGVWRREAGRPTVTPGHLVPDVIDIHAPRLEWPHLDPRAYRQIGVQSQRGCPYRCNFCSDWLLGGQRVGAIAVERVQQAVDEAASFGCREVFFVDAVFDSPPDFGRPLLEALARRRPTGVRFIVQVRGANLTAGYLDLLEAAGVSMLYLSPETGSPAMQRLLNTPVRLERLAEHLPGLNRRKALTVRYTYMVGLPGERWRDLALTFEHMALMSLASRFRNLPFFQPLHVKPWSPLAADLPDNPAGAVRRYVLHRRAWRWYYVAMRAASWITDRLGWNWMSGTKGQA